jgi:hypothetical protein
MMQASHAAYYQILVEGIIDPLWCDAMGGLEITVLRDPGRFPVTLLTGQLVDQSALEGVLDTLFMLHLRLLRVECTRSEGV